jgi:hypothetical protein
MTKKVQVLEIDIGHAQLVAGAEYLIERLSRTCFIALARFELGSAPRITGLEKAALAKSQLPFSSASRFLRGVLPFPHIRKLRSVAVSGGASPRQSSVTQVLNPRGERVACVATPKVREEAADLSGYYERHPYKSDCCCPCILEAYTRVALMNMRVLL